MHFGKKFEGNAALVAKLAIRRPLDGMLEAKRPPKGAKRRPSWRQEGAKSRQNGSKKACKVAGKSSMQKSNKKDANLEEPGGWLTAGCGWLTAGLQRGNTIVN